MIKYLGSKRVLLPVIRRIVGSIPEVSSVVDFFSGTSRVGHALKADGYRVVANDFMAYAHVLATCYVRADRGEVIEEATRLVAELDALPGAAGYFTETFCEKSRFFQAFNGARIDAIREAIAGMSVGPELEAVLLTSLMEAADRVDSTTGVQMAYLKSWAPRSHKAMEMRVPRVLERAAAGRGESHMLESREAARTLRGDLAYIDPPYNQHTYIGNYHVWESLVRWDKPEVYGVACKRVDCRTRKSDFNSRVRAEGALRGFLDAVECPFLLVSFSDEGYVSREAMEGILSAHGDVHTIERDHKRYVGAQIGIHNPRGEKVGRVSHLRNTEYLYLVTPAGYGWDGEAALDPDGAGLAAGSG